MSDLGIVSITPVNPQVKSLNIAGQAQGDVLYFNGSAWTRLGAGVSGQFLKTLGAGANPSWASAGTGGAITHKNTTSKTLAAATAAYDTDYVDITFAASELAATDIIKLSIIHSFNSNTSKNGMFRLDFLNTSANPSLAEKNITDNNAVMGRIDFSIIQDQDTTDRIVICQYFEQSSGGGSVVNTFKTINQVDTNTNNLFLTGFTLRVNLRWSSAATNPNNILIKVLVEKSA